MNKVKEHTLVAIPTSILEEVHQTYKLQESNHWDNNEKKLCTVEIYEKHIAELVAWILHKHYIEKGTKDYQ